MAEGEPATAGVGRPARPVRLNPDGPVALGVEINVDYTAACVLDLTGELRCTSTSEEPASGAAEGSSRRQW